MVSLGIIGDSGNGSYSNTIPMEWDYLPPKTYIGIVTKDIDYNARWESYWYTYYIENTGTRYEEILIGYEEGILTGGIVNE